MRSCKTYHSDVYEYGTSSTFSHIRKHYSEDLLTSIIHAMSCDATDLDSLIREQEETAARRKQAFALNSVDSAVSRQEVKRLHQFNRNEEYRKENLTTARDATWRLLEVWGRGGAHF